MNTTNQRYPAEKWADSFSQRCRWVRHFPQLFNELTPTSVTWPVLFGRGLSLLCFHDGWCDWIRVKGKYAPDRPMAQSVNVWKEGNIDEDTTSGPRRRRCGEETLHPNLVKGLLSSLETALNYTRGFVPIRIPTNACPWAPSSAKGTAGKWHSELRLEDYPSKRLCLSAPGGTGGANDLLKARSLALGRCGLSRHTGGLLSVPLQLGLQLGKPVLQHRSLLC